MNEEKIARKIPLDALLSHLSDLFELGVDYIDITGTLGEEHDMIGILFCKEYMNEEFQSNFEHLGEEYVEEEIEGTPFDPNNIDDIIV